MRSLMSMPFKVLVLTSNASIVLLDMSMPELDGIGATKEIRRMESSNPGGGSTRILALTGMSTLEDRRRAFEAGVDG